MIALKLRRIVPAVGALAVGAALLAVPSPASADATSLQVAYDVSGNTTVAKTGSNITLGPATLNVTIKQDGTFTGSLPLPPTQTTFKALNVLPTTATVNFVPAGQLTGAIGGTAGATLSDTAYYYLKLTNVSVGGVPAFVGNSCQTLLPVKISTATPAGQTFDVLNGGSLVGTYTIGLFVNCGLTTAALDLLIPGTGNTVSLNLSNGRLISTN